MRRQVGSDAKPGRADIGVVAAFGFEKVDGVVGELDVSVHTEVGRVGTVGLGPVPFRERKAPGAQVVAGLGDVPLTKVVGLIARCLKPVTRRWDSVGVEKHEARVVGAFEKAGRLAHTVDGGILTGEHGRSARYAGGRRRVVCSEGDGVFSEPAKAGKQLSELTILIETWFETQDLANILRHARTAGVLGGEAKLVAQYQ